MRAALYISIILFFIHSASSENCFDCSNAKHFQDEDVCTNVSDKTPRSNADNKEGCYKLEGLFVLPPANDAFDYPHLKLENNSIYVERGAIKKGGSCNTVIQSYFIQGLCSVGYGDICNGDSRKRDFYHGDSCKGNSRATLNRDVCSAGSSFKNISIALLLITVLLSL